LQLTPAAQAGPGTAGWMRRARRTSRGCRRMQRNCHPDCHRPRVRPTSTQRR